jgi:hypothetical protein
MKSISSGIAGLPALVAAGALPAIAGEGPAEIRSLTSW